MRTMDARFKAQREQARWAVRRWSEFPADRIPRPLVLPGPEIAITKGFRTGEAQDALREGWIEWATEVPAAVRATLQRSATEQRDGYASEPLKVTHAGAGEYEFGTDRGPLTLPAWWLHGPGLSGPIWVLDPSVDRWEPAEGAAGPAPPAPAQMHPLLAPVELGPDGSSIAFSWLGSAPHVETYRRAEAIETGTAVSVVAVRHDEGFRGWTTAIGYPHRVTARLRAPLGGRVVVDLHGHAVAVTPAAPPSDT
jgi:hypothetical protein